MSRPWITEEPTPQYPILTARCRECKKEIKLPVTHKQYQAWLEKTSIQSAMPQLNSGERELIISGTCNDCFDRIFGPAPQPLPKLTQITLTNRERWLLAQLMSVAVTTLAGIFGGERVDAQDLAILMRLEDCHDEIVALTIKLNKDKIEKILG